MSSIRQLVSEQPDTLAARKREKVEWPNGYAILLPDGFVLRNRYDVSQEVSDPKQAGLFKVKFAKDGSLDFVFLAALCPVSEAFNPQTKNGWGLLVAWFDPSGHRHEDILSRESLEHDRRNWIKPLADGGCSLGEDHQELRRCLTRVESVKNSQGVLQRKHIVDTPGWHECHLVLPNPIGCVTGEQASSWGVNDTYRLDRRQAGTLAEWQDQVARLALGNSRLILGVCFGLAPPLLTLVETEAFILHLGGSSSCGKSTVAYVAASVWGLKVHSWGQTSAALEVLCAQHASLPLVLDEIGEFRDQYDGRELGKMVYTIADGCGHGRANLTETGTGRRVSHKWPGMLCLSTGEHGLEMGGRTVHEGMQVRFIDIPAEVTSGSCFEVLHQFGDVEHSASRQRFAQHLNTHAGHTSRPSKSAGWAGPCFAEYLSQQMHEFDESYFLRTFETFHRHFSAGYAGIQTLHGQPRRVLKSFAFIAFAGEQAIEAGIVPWPKGTAEAACLQVFTDWLAKRGTSQAGEGHRIRVGIRNFILQQADRRLIPVAMEGKRRVPLHHGNAGISSELGLAGYWERYQDGQKYYLFRDVLLRDAVPKGTNRAALDSALRGRTGVKTDKDRLGCKVVIDGIDGWYVCLDHRFLTAED